MDFLLELAWKNAAVAGVLAVAAALISRLVRRPAVTNALWLMVLLKLVTPPIWHVPVFWSTHESTTATSLDELYAPTTPDLRPGTTEHALAASALNKGNKPGFSDSESTLSSEKAFSGSLANLSDMALAVSLSFARAADDLNRIQEIEPQVVRSRVAWKEIVAGVWVAGCCTLASILLVRLRRFRRLERLARPASAADCQRLQELAAAIGLKKTPALRFLSARVPPMTWGLANGYEVIVPFELWNSLCPTQRDALLLHELAHLRRGDHWIRHFELLVLLLHWWHPVSWWARHELQKAEEECCDAWVVQGMPEIASHYAELIVETVAYLSQPPSPILPPLASGLGQIKHVRKRLIAILGKPASPRLSILSGLSLVLVGSFLLPVIPGSAKAPATEASNAIYPFSTGSSGEVLGPDSPGFANVGLANPSMGPAEERLAILQLQLVQREAELTEERLLLEQAVRNARRGTALAARGAVAMEIVEQSLSEQKIREARIRGREAAVKELKLLISREETRAKRMKETAMAAAKPEDAAETKNAEAPAPEAQPFPGPAVEQRIDRIEKRLDDLMAAAKSLQEELKRENNGSK